MNTLKIFLNRLILISMTGLFMISNSYAEDFDAILQWSKKVGLGTAVNGIISKVHTGTGKVAAKGEVLIQLDPRLFRADLKHKQANLEYATAVMEEAQRELDRQTDMYERTMLSEHELQVAKNNLAQAKALLHQAQSDLTKAKLQLEYSAIRSPFNAVVIENNAVKGKVANVELESNVLVTVAEANRMIARAYVVASKINSLSLNQGVTVKVGDTSYNGKITSLAMEQDKQKPGLYAVDVTFDAKKLRAGQLAKISL